MDKILNKEERENGSKKQNQSIIGWVFALTSGAGAFGFLSQINFTGILTMIIALGFGYAIKALFEYISKDKKSKSVLKGGLYNFLLTILFFTIGFLPIFSDTLDISLVLLFFFSVCFIAFITYLKIKNYA